jgi:hypothetical protein
MTPPKKDIVPLEPPQEFILKETNMPKPPRDKIMEMSSRYIQVYQQLTGQLFRPDLILPIK